MYVLHIPWDSPLVASKAAELISCTYLWPGIGGVGDLLHHRWMLYWLSYPGSSERTEYLVQFALYVWFPLSHPQTSCCRLDFHTHVNWSHTLFLPSTPTSPRDGREPITPFHVDPWLFLTNPVSVWQFEYSVVLMYQPPAPTLIMAQQCLV